MVENVFDKWYNVIIKLKGGVSMHEAQEKRCLQIAAHIAETGCTIRQAAKIFGVSKSTVFDDVTTRLPSIDINMSKRVREVLEKNKKDRAKRGGLAKKKRKKCSK